MPGDCVSQRAKKLQSIFVSSEICSLHRQKDKCMHKSYLWSSPRNHTSLIDQVTEQSRILIKNPIKRETITTSHTHTRLNRIVEQMLEKLNKQYS